MRTSAAVVAALACFVFGLETAHADGPPPANLALVATATTSFVSGHETIHALNSGFDPENSNDKRHGAYGNWPMKGTQWVEYTWSQADPHRQDRRLLVRRSSAAFACPRPAA